MSVTNQSSYKKRKLKKTLNQYIYSTRSYVVDIESSYMSTSSYKLLLLKS